jgi:hypothetical protein
MSKYWIILILLISLLTALVSIIYAFNNLENSSINKNKRTNNNKYKKKFLQSVKDLDLNL